MGASVQQLPGVHSAEINFASGILTVEFDEAAAPLERVVALVRASGHGIEPLGGATTEHPPQSWWARHRAAVAVSVSGSLIAAAWVLGAAGAPEGAQTAAYALAIIAGGTLTWRRALISLRARMLDMNVLMSIAVLGAAAIGQWQEGATVIFLFALGGWLEARALTRTRRSIRDLMDLTPPQARVRRDGQELLLPPEDVLIGDVLVVRPGERVALDGTILTGTSAFDEAAITGESIPVDRSAGGHVFAGSLNTSGLVEVEVTAVAGSSTLARIIYLVEEAQAAKAPAQQMVDRFSRWYTPVVVMFAVLVAVGPPVAGAVMGWDVGTFSTWLYRALVLLVISCPCALVVSTPVAVVSAITRATKDGLLVKGGAYLELAAKVRAVAFDKTGTLTRGKPAVVDVVGLRGLDRAHVLGTAATLEQHSNHPLAQAAVASAREEGFLPAHAAEFEELPGRGVTALLGERRIALGSPSFARELGALDAETDALIEASERTGATVLVLIEEGAATGFISLADELRDEARAAVRALHATGVEHVVMLTGDNERTAAAIADRAGVTGHMARLLPEDKTAAVHRLRERYGVVAMVGDGINDAPALAAADIGIAMGAAGSDAAIETADVALMRDDLMALAGFLRLGKRTVANIKQNVTVSVVVKLAVLALAVLGKATLWMAVLADTGVALLVILNGLRLLRKARA